MVIERKIKINDKNYFLGIEIKYNNKGIVEKKMEVILILEI